MNTEDKLPPHEPEMEIALIGCMLTDPQLIDECSARFKAGGQVFYLLSCQKAFDGLIAMRLNNEPVDAATVQPVFKDIGGIAFYSECTDACPSSANWTHYADKVAEAYMLRKTMAACTEAAAAVYDDTKSADEVISNIESKLIAIREIRSNDIVVNSRRATEMLTNHLEQRFALKGEKSGIVTGLWDFDNITDGLQYAEQTIIGARPSQGKTALATTIINRVCLQDGIPTLVITLEMSIHALCRRLLSNYCEIPMRDLKSGNVHEQDMSRMVQFNSTLSAAPIYFMDAISGTDSVRICSNIRRMVKTSGVKLVVIDYLQKIQASGKHEKRTYEVGQVSGALKAIAVETGCALLTLAQLSREPEKDKGRVPRLSDLADSAQIERDGDCITLLERSRENGGHEAKLHIAKQRDGEIGTVPLYFDGRFCLFKNLTKENHE